MQRDSGNSVPVGNPIASYPAGTVTMVTAGSLLVFLRRDIGIRLLKVRSFVITYALLVGVFRVLEGHVDIALTVFVVVAMILVLVHRTRHASRIRTGMPEWHTYDTGRSTIFGFVPLPPPFVRGVIEPIICGLLGWWLVSRGDDTFWLGAWIMWSALMLFLLERSVRIAQRERLFDLGDAVAESADFARRAESFTTGTSQASTSSRRAAAAPNPFATAGRAFLDWWLKRKHP